MRQKKSLFVLLGLLASILLSACERRGALQVVEEAYGHQEKVYVATTRMRSPDGFGIGRSPHLNYAIFDVNIPPNHETGNIEWPDGPVNPARDFYVSDINFLSGRQQFIGKINQEPANRQAYVFVHGYNTNFAEALYRFSQIAYDYDVEGVNVLYSWPSAGDARLYLRDRDSVMFARSGLVNVLNQLQNSDVEQVILIAHSIGSQLAIEALRQKALQDDALWSKLQTVVLLSPDIDLEVFHQQALEIGTLPENFVIFASGRDRVLQLSGWLRSGEQLGRVGDPQELADLPVLFVSNEYVGGHFAAATSPEVIELIRASNLGLLTLENSSPEGVELFAQP